MASPRRQGREVALQVLCAVDANPDLDAQAAVSLYVSHLLTGEEEDADLPGQHAFDRQFAGAPARLQLARILERRGRSAEALEAYRYVAYAWRNADPELQPVVAEARLAIQRLSAVAALAAPAASAYRSPQHLP